MESYNSDHFIIHNYSIVWFLTFFLVSFSVWAILSTSSTSYFSSSSWVAVIALHHHYSEATQTLTLEGRNRGLCGGISSYGPFGMLTSMGAHAAMEMKRADDPSNPHRGYTKIVAKWVPPSNWENIIYRKMITIQWVCVGEKWSLSSECVGENDHYLVSVWEKMITI